MADTPIAQGPQGFYPSDMETRVAILETLAQQTQLTLQGIRDDLRGLRQEMLGQGAELRREMASQGTELRREITEIRRVLDRDFRLTFGAIIGTAVGLAALIARVAHWL